MRQVHLIRIHGEDLRLGVAPLDLQREQHLLHLAAEAAIAAVQKKISGQLHGDGAGAFGAPAFQQIAVGRARDTRKIDAPVIFEVLVFDGGDRAEENFRALLVSHQYAPLQSKTGHHLAVVSVNLGDYVRAIGFQRTNLRQITGVDEEQTARRAQRNRTEQKEGDGYAVN